MSFSQSQKAPPQFQNGLYVRRNEKGEQVIAGKTSRSEQYGLDIGHPIGQAPKQIPIYEESNTR